MKKWNNKFRYLELYLSIENLGTEFLKPRIILEKK
jgi:hypothetical protein